MFDLIELFNMAWLQFIVLYFTMLFVVIVLFGSTHLHLTDSYLTPSFDLITLPNFICLVILYSIGFDWVVADLIYLLLIISFPLLYSNSIMLYLIGQLLVRIFLLVGLLSDIFYRS